jgi:hypothetical protein
MNKYHKIQTAWLRDPDNKFKTLLEGQWSKAEFEYLKDLIWTWREKIDGTNIRVIWNPNFIKAHYGTELEFRGKTDGKSQLPPSLLARLPEIFYPEVMRKAFEDKPVCLYGEGFGAKIQKAGKFYLPDSNDFILFDVKIGDYWLQRIDVERIADRFGIKVVPIIGEGTLEEAIEIVRIGYHSQISIKEQLAEGIVTTPKVELFGRNGARIITKIKHKDFRK